MAELIAVRLRDPHAVVNAWDRVANFRDALLPLDPFAPDERIDEMLERFRPSVLLDEAGTHKLPGAEVPGGTALVIATSGSTGPPKGVMIGEAALRHSTRASVQALGCQPDERWLGVLPMHHIAGLQTVLRSRSVGVEADLHARFELDALAATEARHVALVPTMLHRAVEAGLDLSRFASVLVGGARLDPELRAAAEDAGGRLVESYGMTETCGGCVYDGRPLPDVEVRLGDGDRVLLRGPMLCDGYRAGEQTPRDADGWWHTADRGRLSEDGRLEVLGRLDDVVISGGENIPAAEVSAVVASHPAIEDAAVVGVADPEWGERVVAVVVLADGAAPPTLDELRDHVALSLPRRSAPHGLVVTDAIPRDGLGKPDRTTLLDLAARADG